jgi:glycosyltransferase involved in cell wall biosynthesis
MDNGEGRPLRVLIACSSRKWIGEAAHCLALYERLAERGHQPLLVVREGWDLEARAREEKLDVVALRFRSRFSPLSDWHDVRRLARLVRRRAIDVVHCHRGKDHWIAAIALAMFGLRVPLVRTRHVVTPVSSGVFNRWLFGRATAQIVAVSHAAAASFSANRRRWFERSLAAKTRVIHPAVDLDRFSPDRRSEDWRAGCGVEEGDVLIGLIGRFQRVKGQYEFLRSAGIIARDYPRVSFLMAGRGGDEKRRRYRHMAESLGIDERFILLGELDDVPKVIASLDIGVVASLGSEGSSRVVLEYMASQRAIVASRVGGIPDLIDDGVHGRLIAPGDVAALRDAVRDLLSSPTQRRQLAEAARTRAEQYFNFQRWIDQMTRVYHDALGRAPAPAHQPEPDAPA